MNDSKKRKTRKCKACGNSFFVSSKNLVEHANTCKRMEAIGLKLGGGLTYSNPERGLK